MGLLRKCIQIHPSPDISKSIKYTPYFVGILSECLLVNLGLNKYFVLRGCKVCGKYTVVSKNISVSSLAKTTPKSVKARPYKTIVKRSTGGTSGDDCTDDFIPLEDLRVGLCRIFVRLLACKLPNLCFREYLSTKEGRMGYFRTLHEVFQEVLQSTLNGSSTWYRCRLSSSIER